MNYFTVFCSFYCIAAVAAGGSRSALKSIPSIFDAERDVNFNLVDHKDSDNPHQLKFNSTIEPEWINNQWKTVFFIHGWIGGNRMAEIMHKAYLTENDSNVNLIEVSWLRGAYSPAYFPSVERVPKVGEAVAKFIGLNRNKIDLEKLIIVGHSLGAHAAGFAGKFLQSTYRINPRLIVGLDPAGPLFHGTNNKLQPTDAQDVLVIHTSQLFGHMAPLGTCDVYINGGKLQPGCNAVQSHSFAKLFYRELVNGKKPLVAHKFSSFGDVENEILPDGEKVQLFHGVPFPPKGTLIYVSTKEQPELVAEVQQYIYPDAAAIKNYCTIL